MIARSFVRCLAVAAVVLSAQAANAQTTPGQSPPSVAQTLSQSQFVNGGLVMANEVQALLADKTTLAAIIAFARTANEDQRKAIGQGLAQTAKASVSGGDPGYANQIQQAVAGSGLPELAKAYAEAAGDTATASIGGGGGGGGGGPTAGGPPTGGTNNGNAPGGSTSTRTQAFGLTGSGLGGGGFSQVSAF